MMGTPEQMWQVQKFKLVILPFSCGCFSWKDNSLLFLVFTINSKDTGMAALEITWNTSDERSLMSHLSAEQAMSRCPLEFPVLHGRSHKEECKMQ